MLSTLISPFEPATTRQASKRLTGRVPSSTVRRTAVGTLAGLIATLCVAEGVVRLFVTANGPPSPAIRNDAFDLQPVTARQIEEGIGTAHFSTAGARLTGNTPLANGPVAVIVGDSYVVAREVSDEATMGSRLERIAREAKVPLNVRQYGWRGASPARYVVASSEILSRWNPPVVFIPLSSDDFDEHAVGGTYPWLSIGRDGNATVVTDPAGDVAIAAPPRSVLLMLVTQRWRQLVARAPRQLRQLLTSAPASAPTRAPQTQAPAGDASTLPPPESIAGAVVRALKNAYGERLILLYVADVRVNFGSRADDAERRMLTACEAEHVVCESMRPAMLDARAHGIIARGFSTTTLGVGHLNAEGHRLVAAEMWNLARARISLRSAK